MGQGHTSALPRQTIAATAGMCLLLCACVAHAVEELDLLELEMLREDKSEMTRLRMQRDMMYGSDDFFGEDIDLSYVDGVKPTEVEPAPQVPDPTTPEEPTGTETTDQPQTPQPGPSGPEPTVTPTPTPEPTPEEPPPEEPPEEEPPEEEPPPI